MIDGLIIQKKPRHQGRASSDGRSTVARKQQQQHSGIKTAVVTPPIDANVLPLGTSPNLDNADDGKPRTKGERSSSPSMVETSATTVAAGAAAVATGGEKRVADATHDTGTSSSSQFHSRGSPVSAGLHDDSRRTCPGVGDSGGEDDSAEDDRHSQGNMSSGTASASGSGGSGGGGGGGGGGDCEAGGRTCVNCRKSKVKCSRGSPCVRCKRLKLTCVAQTRGRGRPVASAKKPKLDPAVSSSLMSAPSAPQGGSTGSTSAAVRIAQAPTSNGRDKTEHGPIGLAPFAGSAVSVSGAKTPAGNGVTGDGPDNTNRTEEVNWRTPSAPAPLSAPNGRGAMPGQHAGYREAESGDPQGRSNARSGVLVGSLPAAVSPQPDAVVCAAKLPSLATSSPQQNELLDASDSNRPTSHLVSSSACTLVPTQQPLATSKTSAAAITRGGDHQDLYGVPPLRVLSAQPHGSGSGGGGVFGRQQQHYQTEERSPPMWHGGPRSNGSVEEGPSSVNSNNSGGSGGSGGSSGYPNERQTTSWGDLNATVVATAASAAVATAPCVASSSSNSDVGRAAATREGMGDAVAALTADRRPSFTADRKPSFTSGAAVPGSMYIPGEGGDQSSSAVECMVSIRDPTNGPAGRSGGNDMGEGATRGPSSLWPTAGGSRKRGLSPRGDRPDSGHDAAAAGGDGDGPGVREKPAKSARWFVSSINGHDTRSGMHANGGEAGVNCSAAVGGGSEGSVGSGRERSDGGRGDDAVLNRSDSDTVDTTEDPTDTIVTGFWRLFHGQEVHRPKAVLVIRHWALCALDRRSTRLMRKTVTMARALRINVGEILNDYSIYAMFHELLREAEAGQPVTPARNQPFEHRVEVPAYIRELSSKVAAVSMRVVVRGQSCFLHNDMCRKLFLSSEEANAMYAENRQDVWATCIHPDDHKTFFESLALQLFHVPGHFSESTQILKCRDRLRVPFLALVHFRYEFQDGGNYAAFGLSMHPLPSSPYLQLDAPRDTNDNYPTPHDSKNSKSSSSSSNNNNGNNNGHAILPPPPLPMMAQMGVAMGGVGASGTGVNGSLPGAAALGLGGGGVLGMGGLSGGVSAAMAGAAVSEGVAFTSDWQVPSSSTTTPVVLPPLDMIDGGQRRATTSAAGAGGLSPLRPQQQLQRQGQQQSQSSMSAEVWSPCPSLAISHPPFLNNNSSNSDASSNMSGGKAAGGPQRPSLAVPHPPFLNNSSSNDDASSSINSCNSASGSQRQHHQQQEQYRSRVGESPHQGLRPLAGMSVGGPEAAPGGGGGRVGLGTHSSSSSSGDFETTRSGGASNNGGESSGGGGGGGGGVSMMEMGSERHHGCGGGIGGSGADGRFWEGARRGGTGRNFFDLAAFTRAEKRGAAQQQGLMDEQPQQQPVDAPSAAEKTTRQREKT